MFRKIINSIPNTITLLNLLSGIVAISFAFQPATETGALQGWQWTALFIAAAALFDFLDGLAARLLNARSEIGKELDSLCDLVSFGVAPALLLLNVIRLDDTAYWWSWAALFIPLMGALRLARFNVYDSGDTTFRGLPIPANAIFWIGYVAALMNGDFTPRMNINTVIIAAVALLMVSNLKMFSLKIKSFGFVENIGRIITLVGAALFIIFMGLPGLACSIVLYIVVSFLQTIIHIRFEEK